MGRTVGFAEWAEEWKSTIVDLRPSTKARDVGYLERYVLPRFGSLELGEIDHMMVRSWVAELSASGLAPSTTTKAAQLLSKIMRARPCRPATSRSHHATVCGSPGSSGWRCASSSPARS